MSINIYWYSYHHTEKSLYRKKDLKKVVESALGKRIVSLGESGSFVWGKSEFPLRKVKEAGMG